MKKHASHHATLALVTLGISVVASHGAIEVTPDHIVSGSATGTLVAIDVPNVTSSPTFGGPVWTTGSGINASAADQGFTAPSGPNDGIREADNNNGGKGWEPDGTPLSEALGYFTYSGNSTTPSVSWNFGADSGITIPDGAVINAIYVNFGSRGSSDGMTYRYTEGAATGAVTVPHNPNSSVGDLVVSWTDSASATHSSNFERIFNTPITVEGGDGFELLGYEDVGNASHIDAVILDVVLPKAGAPAIVLPTAPADEAPNALLNSNLVATFDEPIALTGTGSVTIRNLTLSSDEVISLPDARVSFSGVDLVINPSSNLATSTHYAVLISSDAIVDLDTVPTAFAGISDPDVWDFTTTSDGVAPTIASRVPVDDATNVGPYADIEATFSEDAVLTGAGTIIIRDVLGASDAQVINLPSSRVSLSVTDLTVTMLPHLAASTEYAVQISNDAIEDLNGNPFSGIGDDTTWSFTTAPAPAGGVTVPAAATAITGGVVGIPTYAVIGTLKAIDVPFLGAANIPNSSFPVGPDFSDNADDGFRGLKPNGNLLWEYLSGTSPWEPDGTPLSEAKTYRTAVGTQGISNPDVSWTFDLPDGAVINAVYATWTTSGTGQSTNWGYTEGAATGLYTHPGALPAGDLVLRWFDSAAGSHDGNFQRIFAGPITVEGGDGFTLKAYESWNVGPIDAVVLDVTIGGGTPYENWATGGELFGDDANNDGVSNGLAFLLGAAGPNDDALSLMPTVTETSGGLVLTFDMLDSASRGTAALSVEHSSDLGIGDPWEAALVPDVDNTVNDVVFDIQGSGTFDVTATIPVSKAAGGKLFGRLKATE